MPGWQFRVVTKKLDGAGAGEPTVETYVAYIADKAGAWAAATAVANKGDPLAVVEVLGEVPDAVLLAEGIAAGGVKLTERTL